MKLSIAEVTVAVEGCHDAVLAELEAYRADGLGEPEVVIRCDTAEEIPALPLEESYGTRHILEEFGTCGGWYISQERTGAKSLSTLRFSPDFRRVACSLVDVSKKGGASLESRTKIALKDCMVNCLPAFGGITYHASAIAFDGAALLFAAPSGTGKSTHASLWRKYYPDRAEYINDDTPIIRKKDGAFYAYGSPWAGLSGIQQNISAPIKAIVYLEQASENSICPMSQRERSLRALCSVRGQHFPVQRERQARLLFELMSAVPVYRLSCDISQGAVEAVRSLLF